MRKAPRHRPPKGRPEWTRQQCGALGGTWEKQRCASRSRRAQPPRRRGGRAEHPASSSFPGPSCMGASRGRLRGESVPLKGAGGVPDAHGDNLTVTARARPTSHLSLCLPPALPPFSSRLGFMPVSRAPWDAAMSHVGSGSPAGFVPTLLPGLPELQPRESSGLARGSWAPAVDQASQEPGRSSDSRGGSRSCTCSRASGRDLDTAGAVCVSPAL